MTIVTPKATPRVIRVPVPKCQGCGAVFADAMLRHEPGCQESAWMATDERYNRSRAMVGMPRHPCLHPTPCPDYAAADHDAAKVVAEHHDQGWILLCNGVVVFDDTGESSPTGVATAPHRPDCPHAGAR